jgi:hypothetical protein
MSTMVRQVVEGGKERRPRGREREEKNESPRTIARACPDADLRTIYYYILVNSTHNVNRGVFVVPPLQHTPINHQHPRCTAVDRSNHLHNSVQQ